MSETTIPTWGYKPGEGRIFELKPGEKLPEGWLDTPQPAPDNSPEEPKKRKTMKLEVPE